MTTNNSQMKDDFFAANKMLNVLWKRKFHILILTVIAVVAGAIFSGPSFITPRFKSEATLYPSNISAYSEESETEQYMQWLTSHDIKDSIIKKFNLFSHYGIDPNAPYSYSEMMFVYGKNIRCEQTVYDAVQITVFDKDPKVACDIANEIIALTDSKIRRAQKIKFDEVIPNTQIMVDAISSRIDSLTNLMLDVKSSAANASPEYIDLALKLYSANEVDAAVQERYLSALSDARRDFTYSNIISCPYVADKKATPIRWVIVVFAGVGMLLLSFLGFLIAENIPEKRR